MFHLPMPCLISQCRKIGSFWDSRVIVVYFVIASACLFARTTTWTTEAHDDDAAPGTVPADKSKLPGHLKPIGSHRPPEGCIDEVTGFLEPENFFQNYVAASKPVIFKGGAKNIPAYSLWSDDYMIKKFGHIPVDVEEGKKEDRDHGVFRMPISSFIHRYTTADIYMVQDVMPEMLSDLCLPLSLQCGGAQDKLELAVLWFSSGNTKSVLHYDNVENINCLLDGVKNLVLIDKYFDNFVEHDGFDFKRGFSLVDVESVDMTFFSHLQNVPWWSAQMEKGDCLYIPYRWYHTVDSAPGRNLAVNLWFVHPLWFNSTDCESFTQKESCDMLSRHTLLSALDGEGSDEKLRLDIFEDFEGLENISLTNAIDLWEGYADEADIQAVFEVVDLNKDLELSWEEVYMADPLDLVDDFPFLLAHMHPEEDDDEFGDYQDIPEHAEL